PPNYASRTEVTLTAQPDSNSSGAGLSGCSCASATTCHVTMNQARSVTASFATIQNPLSVSKTGSGGGTVTSSPGGINCGSTCSHTYAGRTKVTLTATRGPGSTFAGWSGACTGTGTCEV